MLGDKVVAALRETLRGADYTVDAVTGRLGESAHSALARNETAPAYRASGSGDALDTLIRLFLLQREVPGSLVEKVLPGLTSALSRTGILVVDGNGMIRAGIDIRPYDEAWWVVADLTPGLDGRREPIRPDYVLGIAPASLNLAGLVVPGEVGSALDLGTGCGVQALHLSRLAGTVVGTDVNERALRMAALTMALNQVEVDLRAGSLYEPVAGERYDLIVSNPPFVVSPPGPERLTYRETPLAADAAVEHLVRQAPLHLTEGGRLQTLANWAHRRGEDWRDRVGGWLGDRSAWAVQRELLGCEEYAELWLRDAGLHGTPGYVQRYDEWLRWFDGQGIEAIGMGWIALHHVEGRAECEEWPYEVEQPLGPHLGEHLSRAEDVAAGGLDDLDAVRLVTAPDVVEERHGAPGAEDPETIVLRRQRGMRRAEQVDTVLAGFVGACDGELTAGQILDALAQLLGTDAAELRNAYAERIRALVVEGFVGPVDNSRRASLRSG